MLKSQTAALHLLLNTSLVALYRSRVRRKCRGLQLLRSQSSLLLVIGLEVLQCKLRRRLLRLPFAERRVSHLRQKGFLKLFPVHHQAQGDLEQQPSLLLRLLRALLLLTLWFLLTLLALLPQ